MTYALAIAVGFMLSPVVGLLGIGYFGLQFSDGFLVVVFLAHIGYGLALGWLAHRFLGSQPMCLGDTFQTIVNGRSYLPP